jgi:hypothetical protein
MARAAALRRRCPKSHPKVEGKIARSARLYKVIAVDPRCYEHTFALDFHGYDGKAYRSAELAL